MTPERYAHADPLATFELDVTPRNAGRHFVYFASDQTGRLLYVGVTGDIFVRVSQHAVTAPWYPDMHHLRVETYPTRADAENREAEAIATLSPAHNKARPRGGRHLLRTSRLTRTPLPPPPPVEFDDTDTVDDLERLANVTHDPDAIAWVARRAVKTRRAELVRRK
jgi:hypothetical protein